MQIYLTSLLVESKSALAESWIILILLIYNFHLALIYNELFLIKGKPTQGKYKNWNSLALAESRLANFPKSIQGISLHIIGHVNVCIS